MITKNILIVEDDITSREYFAEKLKKYGYKVYSTCNGLEALECLKNQHINLIITDINMPKMDGYEFIRIVRNEHPFIPVIVTSGYSDSETIISFLKFGIVDYLIKPVNEDFIFRVEKALYEKILKENTGYAFVIAPFDKRYDTVYREAIIPAVNSFGLSIRRADDIYSTKPVIEHIINQIADSRLIIAVITDNNPNVFYELGIAHTLCKKSIILSENSAYPFDIRHLQIIVYQNTKEGIENLKEKCISAIQDILKI